MTSFSPLGIVLKKSFPLTFALCLCAIGAPPAFGWKPYDEVNDGGIADDFRSLPIEEPFVIGGIKLWVDRTQLGYGVVPASNDPLIGTMLGKDYHVRILRLPNARGFSLEQMAYRLPERGGDPLHVKSIHRRDGVVEVKAVYGQKPTFFSNRIDEIRYYLTNLKGETICFSAVANQQDPDWDYFDYLMKYAEASIPE